MNIGDRVHHSKYGDGTIIDYLFRDTKRELLIVKFDVSNSELHNGLGLSDDTDCWCCDYDDLEIIKG